MTFNSFLVEELATKLNIEGDATAFFNARYNRLRYIESLPRNFTLASKHSKQVTSMCTPVWSNKNSENDKIHKLKNWIKKYSKKHKKQYTIDHVIPLRGELVTGLNVTNNLRIVVKRVNQTKSNSYEIS